MHTFSFYMIPAGEKCDVQYKDEQVTFIFFTNSTFLFSYFTISLFFTFNS